jgi:hypothetical protein
VYTFLGALAGFSEGPSRITMSDSLIPASSTYSAAGGVPKRSLDPMVYFPVARLNAKMVYISCM